MDHNAENTNKPLALIITLLSHGLLLLILLFISITTPIPPYPEGGGSGMGVNFGTSDDGFGEEQPEKLLPVSLQEPVHTEKVVQKAVKTENIVTQDNEESAVVKTDNTKKNEKDIVKKEDMKEEIKPEVKTETKKEVNKKALFPGSKNNNTKSEGETSGTGDQGKKDGNPNNKYHWGNGNGEGNGNGTGKGKGDGSGDGEGDGNKNGKGVDGGKDKGISYSLAGRKPKAIPSPDYNDDDQGKVVVKIKVDRDGNVVDATIDKGTTTSSSTLLNAAKRAARSAKFSKNPDAAEFQFGTITYHFKLQ